MPTPDVRVRLSAEGTAEVIAAFRKVQAEAGVTARKSAAGMAQYNSVLAGTRNLLGQLGLALSVGAFVSFIRRTAESAEAVGNLGQRTGKTSETMLALSLLADRTNTSVDALAKSVTFFGRKLEEMQQGGGEAAELLRRIGLSSRDFKGKELAASYELVVKRLGQLENSGEKAVVTQKLLGRTADQLIPLFNELANGALARTVERMRELGISPAVIEQVEQLDEALDDMNQDAKLVGLAFVSGLAPELSATIKAMLGDLRAGAEGWAFFGKLVGNVLKFVTALVASTFDIVGTQIGRLMILLDSLVRASGAALRGNMAQARAILQVGAEHMQRANAQLGQRLRDRAKLIAGIVNGQEEAKATRTGVDPPDEVFRQREQAIAAALDNELKIARLHFKAEEDEQKRAFERGLTDVRAYYAARRDIVERESQAEIIALLKRRAVEATNPDEVARRQALAKTDAEIMAIAIRGAGELAKLQDEHLADTRDLADQRVGFLKKQMELEGERHAAAMLNIDEEAAALDRILRDQGVPDDERGRQVEDFRSVSNAAALAGQLEVQGDRELAKLAIERREIENDITAGRIGRLAGERAIFELERQRIPQLRAIAQAQLAAARDTKDEDQILRARQVIVALGEIEARATAALNPATQLGAALTDSFQSSLAGLLALNEEFLRAEGTIKHFLFTVSEGVRQILSELLAAEITRGLLGLFGFSTGGKVTKKAAGGLVTGPGTGTSDSIPARLSAGEYVVRARGVTPATLPILEGINRAGAAALRDVDMDAVRRGMSLSLRPLATHAAVQRFADGGLVRAAAVAADTTASRTDRLESSLTVRVEPGAEVVDVSTPKGMRLLIQQMGRHKNAINQVLGR